MSGKNYGVIQEQGFVVGNGLGFTPVSENQLEPNKTDPNKKNETEPKKTEQPKETK